MKILVRSTLRILSIYWCITYTSILVALVIPYLRNNAASGREVIALNNDIAMPLLMVLISIGMYIYSNNIAELIIGKEQTDAEYSLTGFTISKLAQVGIVLICISPLLEAVSGLANAIFYHFSLGAINNDVAQQMFVSPVVKLIMVGMIIYYSKMISERLVKS